MTNFLDPAILFFIFGVFAGSVKSNLEIPPQISRFLSLYLLMALGLKGGFALHKSGFTSEIGFSLGLAIFLAIIIPIIGYLLLRRRLNTFDAAAIAATYGSVSAVTFITATQYLDQFNIEYLSRLLGRPPRMGPCGACALGLSRSHRQRGVPCRGVDSARDLSARRSLGPLWLAPLGRKPPDGPLPHHAEPPSRLVRRQRQRPFDHAVLECERRPRCLFAHPTGLGP